MSSMKGAIGIGACAVAGAMFLGYCVYFDKKRRNDPDFRRKLREKRRLESKKGPNLKDQEATKRYFYEQLQLGEELISVGEIQKGLEHMVKAITITSQPEALLQVMQQTLPPSLFHMLLTLLKEKAQEAKLKSEAKITEEEVE